MTNLNIRSLESRLINNSNSNLKTSRPTKDGKSFNHVLETYSRQEEIKFSKHALERLNTRNINLESQDLKRLSQAFDMAKNKGVKEALILMDNQAFIASVGSKTVITAMGREALEENIFTNIDGAVII